MVEPSKQTAPQMQLEIDHVYGFRTSECQQNLRYNSKGEAVFMAASVGIVHDPNTNN
jgi:hypothetical protein